VVHSAEDELLPKNPRTKKRSTKEPKICRRFHDLPHNIAAVIVLSYIVGGYNDMMLNTADGDSA
jgi:hypothetical protein